MSDSKQESYKHWSHTTDTNNIVWLYLDKQDSPVNSLNSEVMTELDQLLDWLATQKVCGAVFSSAKKTGFIAGADISEMEHISSKEEACDKVITGQKIFSKLHKLPFPTVALVQGFCLGGGLEFALSCMYRIAEDKPETRLGLPEVMLGLNPGWGGTTVLPRLIGAPAAMNLILNGHGIAAKSAERLGFVDAAVPARHLNSAATQFILNKPKVRTPSFFQNLTNMSLVRKLLAKVLRKKVSQKVREAHYPAPFAIIDTWEKYGVSGAKALEESAKTFGELLMTETGQNLGRVFFLQERLKGLAKGSQHKVKHVHVIGAGVMGGDIASWCALRGFTVTLQDREPKFIGPAIKRANALFKRKLKKPRLVQAAMDRLIPDVEGTGVARADVIIEAIFENLEVKQQLFKSLEATAKKEAILATNTSSLLLADIRQTLSQPERLVGIHFFNPVAKMPLVEIVHDETTDSSVVQQATSFVKQINRLPMPAKSSPCFLVNRVLAPYLLEAALLLDEGVSPVILDEAIKNFGMPMGPAELVDTVGIDVCVAVAEKYTQAYGGEVPTAFTSMVEKGMLGKKTGKGIYTYKKGQPVKPKIDANAPIPEDITDRLVMRLLNESVACLNEKIVDDADLVDAGMIFGTGFAPFRGGPMHYIKTEGRDMLLHKLENLHAKYGDRFKPDTGWDLPDVKGTSSNNVTRLRVA